MSHSNNPNGARRPTITIGPLGSFFQITRSASPPDVPIPAPFAEVGFVFSNHTFGLGALPPDASIPTAHPDGFVFSNRHPPCGTIRNAATPRLLLGVGA